MGSFVAQDALRGFIIPELRCSPSTVNRSESTIAQASPRGGGTAQPTSTSARLALVVTGDLDSDKVFQVEQGGHAILGRGCRVSVRGSSEATTLRQGWNAPNYLAGLTHADWSTTVNSFLAATAMGNGQVLVGYRAGGASTPATAYLQTYTPDTDTWSGTIAFPEDVSITGGIALATLPEGNVLAMYRRYSAVSGQDYWTVQRYSAIDAVSGGSWTRHAQACLDVVPTTTGTRTRLLVLPNGDMAFFYAWSGNTWQYASDSHGTRFTRVLAATPAAATQFDAVVTSSGKILVVAESGGLPKAYTIGSPWTPYTAVTAVTIDGSTAAVTDLWLVADPVGRIYCYGRVTGSDAIYCWYSDDEGGSWVEFDYVPLNNSDANTAMQKGQAVHAGGAIYVAHQHTDSLDTRQNSVWLAKFGGFSNVTIGQGGSTIAQDQEQDRVAPGGGALGAGAYLLPYCEPKNAAPWTMTGVGTDTLVGGRAQFDTVANTRYASLTTVPTTTQLACLIHAIGICSAGGSTALHNAGFSYRWTDGATIGYEAGVYLTTTTISVRDIIAGTTLATATPAGGINASEIEILFYMECATHLFVAYKRPQDATWTEIYEGGATTSTGAGVGTRYVRVGTVNASTATHAFRVFHVSLNSRFGLLGSPLNSVYPNLIGRALTGLPAPIYSRSAYGRRQTYIRAKDGPGRAADTFTSQVRASFPIDNVMWQFAPSPTKVHRSLNQNADTALVWDLEGGSTVTSFRSTMISLAILNTNQRYHQLYGDPDDGGGYDLLGTADLATGFTGLSYARTGNVIRVNGGASATRYVTPGELVGAYVDLGGGYVRRIASHTEGAWVNANTRQVELVLATSGRGAYTAAEPGSGTCAIIHHSGILVIPNINTATYKKLKWTSPAGSANTEGWEHGLVFPGRVQVVGKQWSRGWSVDRDPNAEDVEVKPMSYVRKALGRAPRSWALGWPDGIDISNLRAASPSPDYFSDDAADTLGLVAQNEVPYLLQSLVEELRSGEVPLICLSKIPTTTTTITDPTLYLYGHLVSGSRLEHVLGPEGTGELFRHPNLSIREII